MRPFLRALWRGWNFLPPPKWPEDFAEVGTTCIGPLHPLRGAYGPYTLISFQVKEKLIQRKWWATQNGTALFGMAAWLQQTEAGCSVADACYSRLQQAAAAVQLQRYSEPEAGCSTLRQYLLIYTIYTYFIIVINYKHYKIVLNIINIIK